MPAKRIVLDINEPLASLRKALGLTQHEAADLCGVGRTVISNAELRGNGVTVRALAEHLDRYGRRLQLVAVDVGQQGQGET